MAEAENPTICSICEQRYSSKPSTVWCPECEQAFCSDCEAFHNLSKLLKNHVTVPITNYLSLPKYISSLGSFCADHSERCDMFCHLHDKLVCLKCLQDHSDCKGIVGLTSMIQDIKNSETFLDTKQKLFDVNKNISTIEKALQDILENMQNHKEIILSEITEFRETFNEHLDKMEQKLKEEVNKVERKSTDDIKTTMKSLEEMKSQNTTHEQMLDDMTKYGSDLQTFLGLRQISSEISKTIEFVESLVESQMLEKTVPSITFNDTFSLSSDRKTLGTLQFQKVPIHLVLEWSKDKQAQLTGEPIRPVSAIKLNLILTVDMHSKDNRGCTFLPDGRMIFTYLDGISVLNSEGARLYQIPLSPCYAYDVDCIDDKTVGVTSDRSGYSKINIVDINKKVVTSWVDLNKACNGLTFSDGTFFCYLMDKGIAKINISDGKTTTIVDKKFVAAPYIEVFNRKLFYTDEEEHTIFCSDLNGERMWEFKNETVLKYPRGISVDGYGNVYIVCKNGDVFVLSYDGKESRKLIPEDITLKNPYSLCYDRIKNRLLITNKCDKAYLFEVST